MQHMCIYIQHTRASKSNAGVSLSEGPLNSCGQVIPVACDSPGQELVVSVIPLTPSRLPPLVAFTFYALFSRTFLFSFRHISLPLLELSLSFSLCPSFTFLIAPLSLSCTGLTQSSFFHNFQDNYCSYTICERLFCRV